MPIFEFRCNRCRHSFATLVGVVSENGEAVCPACAGDDLTRLVSRFAPIRLYRSTDDIADSIDSHESMEYLIDEVGEEFGDDIAQDIDQLIPEC
jgi:putative FmdB family regulatory protein